MSERAVPTLRVGEQVRVCGRQDLGVGEVLRVAESEGRYQADVVFEGPEGRRLETLPLDRLEIVPGLWDRLSRGDFDPPLDFLLKQLAIQFPIANTGGELSNSRTALLPHQILLTHDVVASSRRRFLIADEVGLGKTIETGMIVRELVAREEASRTLVVCPAGLVKNWQQELLDCFRLRFEVLGLDFADAQPGAWEHHHWVIASIDTLKRRPRLDRLVAGPRWDLVVFDEAHHLSRVRYGTRVQPTQNYRLAEALRAHTRDLLFLSATPHQGDPYQFWSLIQLLDDSLFESADALLEHRGLLGRVMIRRTKREVTDSAGRPIFMRRQVHSQTFPLAVRERAFYDELTDYLREGYGVAGLGQQKTTSRQRAVGFVMATFQKIMSSSPRAIRQALRRRLLVLLAREQMALEGRAARAGSSPVGAAERLLHLQEEMRALAVAIHGIPASPSQRAEADIAVAQVKQRLARRDTDEETTGWALDGDEEGDEGIYADTDIPGEADKVRQLIRLVPEGTDRKFDTLLRGIEQLRREDPAERFVIFTQYRETLEFLREELSKVYGPSRIATIKGGPLDDKIAAIEAFWNDDGARLLISTSAGGEGVNLQVGHILFNYDLPWNPMAVEQRIGRIHRYGQQDTVQVYNLVAEDTVEERIYRLLEEKLLEIARTIGRIDAATGHVVEDFRSEILGFLGSSPDYQDLYKKALVDRDYKRTEREMVDALDRARKASEALRALTQDLDSFNLDHYRTIRGHFTLDHLRRFTERAILRLGGAFIPSGDAVRIETPGVLLTYPRVLRSYQDATFSRELAMRRRNVQLLGLGHPLIDALIRHFHRAQQPGDVTSLTPLHAAERRASVRAMSHLELESGRRRSVYTHLLLSPDGSWEEAPPTWDVESLSGPVPGPQTGIEAADLVRLQPRAHEALAASQARLRATAEGVLSIRHREVGLAVVGPGESASG
jgi:superfamily II DNA or RNA helicase